MYLFDVRLKQLRSEHNLTQKQLGEKIGSSERGIQNYELRVSKPAYDALVALARFFNTSTDYLLGLTSDPTPPRKEPDDDLEGYLSNPPNKREEGSTYG